MASKRQLRVASQIQEILSELLLFEAEDPRLVGVTVMEVTIDRELKYAKVYVSALDGPDAKDDVLSALERASSFLRRELGSRMRLHGTPELRFEWDNTMERAERINQILDSLEIPPDETDTTA